MMDIRKIPNLKMTNDKAQMSNQAQNLAKALINKLPCLSPPACRQTCLPAGRGRQVAKGHLEFRELLKISIVLTLKY